MTYQSNGTSIAVPVGSERVYVDNGSVSNTYMTVRQIVNLPKSVPTAVVYDNAATSGATLSAASLTGATDLVTISMNGTLGAGANIQLPTVASIVALIPAAVAGQTYQLRILNASSANFAWTVTTNTGWTLSGTMTVAQNTWRGFVITLSSLSAATLRSIGTGTNS